MNTHGLYSCFYANTIGKGRAVANALFQIDCGEEDEKKNCIYPNI
jgi:hypothetical protein